MAFFHGLLKCEIGIYLRTVGLVEGQSFLYLGLGQSVFGRNLIRCQVPTPGSHHYRLNADARTAQNGHGLARSTATVGDTGKDGITRALLQGAYLLGDRPWDEFVERHTLTGGPLLRLLLQFGG